MKKLKLKPELLAVPPRCENCRYLHETGTGIPFCGLHGEECKNVIKCEHFKLYEK